MRDLALAEHLDPLRESAHVNQSIFPISVPQPLAGCQGEGL